MITERELRQQAVRAGLGIGQAEHEYVTLCVLDALSQTEPLGKLLCLKGGTALRLLYFADWRYSVDLDFSALPGLSASTLRPFVEAWFGQVEQLHGVPIHARDFHRANGAVRLRAQFVGPLRHPNRLLLDITLDEPILLPPQQRRPILTLFAGMQPDVLTYALEEILAEKLRSILQRGKARDYYDVWRLLKEKSHSFDAAVAHKTWLAKCEHKGLLAPTVERLLAPDLLAEAGVYWERDLVGQVEESTLPAWEIVVSELPALLALFLATGQK